MFQHHPVFSRFQLFNGKIPGGYDLDSFLGTRSRQHFYGQVTRTEDRAVEGYYPNFDNEYFEWIDILESVVAATGRYTMVELGAGYGRWAIRAAFAAQQYYRNIPIHLVAVEADPVHFEWMNLHFKDNKLDPREHRLIQAAISESRGRALFCISGAPGTQFDCQPNVWYGQALTKDDIAAGGSKDDGEYQGFKVLRHNNDGWRSIKVPCVRLSGVLKSLELVDLIDIDIEGQELSAIRRAINDLDTKVKRLHIGTHGKEIEAELRQLLFAHGWNREADYSLFSTSDTPWGTISFDNGVQSWTNPRL